jgi:hypothetical protein
MKSSFLHLTSVHMALNSKKNKSRHDYIGDTMSYLIYNLYIIVHHAESEMVLFKKS